ncbi:MAG: tripartite tricarboxylate transporter substrate binding protein [Gammaproteobacteria bacterium]|nr:tripartite tricarboxylate transporter substrate binding protein [Gammaproteobacteria bacterium]NIR90645.1 tripartite tricarboxylate transporter substrate binding protein [Gammaproteobacteria bacterium]NIU07025.1 tripartite tricarboxylate transporter substrate binding protein [Gammaproteobacteria bacterium]NIV53935.1 tripartite tricarboxylate transporter substrate binding protein [Gammaproteobacteria bacterium]NIW86165.1 tripartite tricarboxylate transporter substrate binding protein [Gammapr
MKIRALQNIRRKGLVLAAAILGMVGIAGQAVAGEWPDRPITLIVPWGAGGGTDTVARTLAAVMEKNLGQPINVVNRTGGSGLIGHAALANADPDGYTIGTINVDLCQLVCKDLTDLTYDKFTQVALLNAAPSGVVVNADSPYKSAQGLLDAVKAQPAGTFTASGTGTGGIWHLAMAGWLWKAGLDPNRVRWVPTGGEAPSLKDLASGAVDFVTVPLSSAYPMAKAGKVRALATMGEERFSRLPDVPTLEEATGIAWTVGTWRMIGAPAGLPDDVKRKLEHAVRQAFDSEEFTSFMEKRGFKKVWKDSEAARQFHQEQDKSICDVMKAAGMV